MRKRITKKEFIKLLQIAKAYKVKLPWKLKRFLPELFTPSYYDIWMVLTNIPKTSFHVDSSHFESKRDADLYFHDHNQKEGIAKHDTYKNFNGSEFLDYLIFAIENKYYKEK